MAGSPLENRIIAECIAPENPSVKVRRVRRAERLDRKDFQTSRVTFVQETLKVSTPDGVLEVKLPAHVVKQLPKRWHFTFDNDQIKILSMNLELDHFFLRLLETLHNPFVPRVLSWANHEFEMTHVEGVDGARYVWANFDELWEIIEQLVKVVIRTYQDRVVNLDLSGRNVIVNTDAPIDKKVKLIDFGMAVPVQAGQIKLDRFWLTVKATFPPEVIEFFDRYDQYDEMLLPAWDYVAFTLAESIAVIACRYTRCIEATNWKGRTNHISVFKQADFNEVFQAFLKYQHSRIDRTALAAQITGQRLSKLLAFLLSPNPQDRWSPEALLDFVSKARQEIKNVPGDIPLPKRPVWQSHKGEFLSWYEDGTVVMDELLIDTIHKTLLDESVDEKEDPQTLALQPQNTGGSDSSGDGVAGSLDTA